MVLWKLVAGKSSHEEQLYERVRSLCVHKLSFRRFTYGNLVTTSPSSK